MADSTVIGRTTFVHGHVSGSGDLAISGRIEGDVSSTGEVVVDAGGLVAASITARRIVVRGAVKGDLVAEESLVLESGARVVGDLRAPRIAIAQGGLVRGHVQTSAAGPSRPRAQAATAGRAAPATEVRATSGRQPDGQMKAAPAHPAPARPAASHAAPAVRTNNQPRGAALAGARPGPPPPVVPALKKGTKAIQKKR
jgi:cytoskeletal protein CcmA (bactofilin family)